MKKDYAVSVKHLILYGVDDPLAHLFVHAAIPLNDENRVRSASEAFFRPVPYIYERI
jgi:hypothetical protein